MSKRRSPRVVGSEYEISLVEMPPPGPPKYELVNAWTPSTPRSTKPPRRDKVPTLIATIALAIAIISLLANMNVLHVPQLIPPTAQYTTTTTTATQILTTTMTKTYGITNTVTQTSTITIAPTQTTVSNIVFCLMDNIEIRMENFTFQRINATHRTFISFINITAPGAARPPNISKNNFTVAYKLDGGPTYTECNIEKINIKGVEMRIKLTCTVPYQKKPYKVHIYFNPGNCIIGAFYG